jgi:hypothetical protein
MRLVILELEIVGFVAEQILAPILHNQPGQRLRLAR